MSVVTLGTDGPLMREGRIRVQTLRGELVQETDCVSLCRCGGTRNPPFCDGSHERVGFRSTR